MSVARDVALTWLAACAVFAITSPAARAQVLPGSIERENRDQDLWRYHAFIGEYRRGRADPVERIQHWDKKRLQRLLASIETTEDELRPWGTVRFQAAAMMHTDAAMAFVARVETDPALLHIDTAGQLLKKAGPDAQAFAGRWCLAVARLLRSFNWMPDTERFLESCRSRWPRDATVLLESGIVQELLASETMPPVIIYLPAIRASPPTAVTSVTDVPPPLDKADVADLKRHRSERLERAAQWLGDALQRDSSNLLVRLRLGRVQTLRNQNDRALGLLQAAAASTDDRTAYLARLFIAALHERQGQLEQAAEAYRAAIERWPLNHAAYLGLSALLQRTGYEDESRTTLRRVVDGAPASRRDPWWSYFAELPSATRARFDDLRREVRE